MGLGAGELKERYRAKWKLGARRELLVLSILNIYLPDGYRAVPTGLGSLSDDYVPRSYEDALEAFDIVVVRGGRVVAYVDVTGVPGPAELQERRGLCVGVWKLWKAERFGVKERAWFVHVEDDGPRTRWVPAPKLEAEGAKHRLRCDERPLLCLDSRKWLTLRHFLEWLSSLT